MSKPTGLAKLLERLVKLDGLGLFQEPLEAKELKQFRRKTGSTPMDFTSMRAIVTARTITSVGELRTCFVLLCDNACAFSKKGDFTFGQAVSLKEKGSRLLDELEQGTNKFKGVLHIGDEIEVEQPIGNRWSGKVADVDENSATCTVKLKGCKYDVHFSEIRDDSVKDSEKDSEKEERMAAIGEKGEWSTKGHPWLGISTRRSIGGTDVDGTITHWLPPRRKAGPGELWRNTLSNGNEENLNEQAVKDAMRKVVTTWSEEAGLSEVASLGKEGAGRAARKPAIKEAVTGDTSGSTSKPKTKGAGSGNHKESSRKAKKQKPGSAKSKANSKSKEPQKKQKAMLNGEKVNGKKGCYVFFCGAFIQPYASPCSTHRLPSRFACVVGRCLQLTRGAGSRTSSRRKTPTSSRRRSWCVLALCGRHCRRKRRSLTRSRLKQTRSASRAR
jgi:hypothetical protein